MIDASTNQIYQLFYTGGTINQSNLLQAIHTKYNDYFSNGSYTEYYNKAFNYWNDLYKCSNTGKIWKGITTGDPIKWDQHLEILPHA